MLKNLSVKAKLWAVASILLLGLVAVTIISIIQIDRISSELIVRLYDESYTSSDLILNADRDLYQALNAIEKVLLGSDEGDIDKHLADYEENIAQVSERMSGAKEVFSKDKNQWLKYKDEVSGKSVFDFFSEFETDFSEWVNKTNSIIASKEEHSEMNTLFDKARTHINSLTDLINTASKGQIEESISKKNTMIVTFIIINIFIIIGAAILVLILLNQITKPLKKLTEAANKLALGEINISVNSSSKDEIGKLMESFSRMVNNIRGQALAVEQIAAGDMTVHVDIKSENDLLGIKLNEMVRTNNEILANISSAADQVAAGSRQVSASSQMLSQGATEQASAIEEITSSMTQVAAQTKQNAVNANKANELALSAKENAVQGDSQMKEMVKAMGDINDSSSNISKIIKVIDEIAFQTNILSLNAAVEAARAGQHGKGFAVVAEEVRNLAARSANAAKETTEMIENSIKKVEAGTKIANSTADALNNIVNGIAKAAALVGDIAAASNEQATGIAQINQAISQVAQVVQTNSATAEEGASASEELSSQADLLKSAVSRYKLKKSNSSNGSGMDSEMVRIIEDVIERKKSNYQLEQLINSTYEAADNREGSLKAKISLEDNNFGKY